VLTQVIGDRFDGISGLSLTIPIAALTAAVVGIPQAAGNITPEILLAALGLAILLPVLPFALELLALRHMNPAAFGTLMAVEPAIGVVLGLVVLQQVPSGGQIVGILLVVAAGAAAQLDGGRRPRPPTTGEPTSELDFIG
jgi:inner membrane transporter RhtA